MRRIIFYSHWLKAFLKWHFRISRTKPGRWRYGAIWSTVSSYDKDRWIWIEERKRDWYKRVDGPLEMSVEYRQEGTAGKGDYLFVPPTGWKTKDDIT